MSQSEVQSIICSMLVEGCPKSSQAFALLLSQQFVDSTPENFGVRLNR